LGTFGKVETTAYVNSLEVLQPVSIIFMSTQTSVRFNTQCSSVNSPANQDEARLFQLSISALATLQVNETHMVTHWPRRDLQSQVQPLFKESSALPINGFGRRIVAGPRASYGPYDFGKIICYE
jgi:hypothetical protein